MPVSSSIAFSNQDSWIQSFNLTAREVDILACLMDQKSSKKIAAILGVKQKTVESHIFNIMQKLDKNSRVTIIDMVKKSTSAPQLMERCHELLMVYEFKETLQKIKQRVPCKGIACRITCQDDTVKKQIETDLNVLNIFCFDRKKEIQTISADICENYQVTFFQVLKQLLPHPLVEEALIRFKHGSATNSRGNVVTHIIQEHSKSHNNLYLLVLLFLIAIVAGLSVWYVSPLFTTTSVRSDFDVSIESKLLKRTKILDQIRILFQGNEPIKVVALVGMSGIGKTMIAHQYAMNQKNSVVWEVHAENKAALIQSFAQLAYAISKTKEEKAELEGIKKIENQIEYTTKLMLFVKQKLKQSNNGWMLLLDNVEALQDIEAFLPTDTATWGSGQVLITTKNNRIANHNFIKESHTIEIPELTEKEKLALFSKIQEKQIVDQKALIEFLRKIPPFPLDVFTAAYYIKNTNNSYDEYLSLLATHQKNDDYFQEIGYYGKTRHQIIASSLDQILKKNKEFQKILLIVSLLNNYDIRVDFLKKIEDPKRVDVFIQKMSQFSLLSRKIEKMSSVAIVSIHQSTQQLILDHLLNQLTPKEQEQQIGVVADILYDAAEEIIGSNNFSRIRSSLLHLSKALDNPMITSLARAKLDVQLGKLYLCVGDAKNAQMHLANGLPALEVSANAVDLPKRVAGMVYLGAASDELAKHQKAIELLEKSVNLYRNKLPQNKEGLALALLYLGKTYSQIREAEQSKVALEESIELYARYGKNKEHEQAKAVTLLAETHMYAGDYKQAEYWFKQNEKLYTIIDKNHPQILWNTLRLGRLYMFTGQHLKAQEIFEKGVVTLKQHFASDIDKLGWNTAYLGDVYRSLGLFDQSKQALLESFALYKKLYGLDHIMIAWVEGYLGWFYYDNGQYKEAQDYLEKSLAMHRKHYGQNHKRYAPVMHALANTYTQLYAFEAAEKLFQDCLDVYASQFGKEHTQYALVLRDYGRLCISKKNYEQAEAYLNQAFIILERGQHGENYRCLEYLGDLYHAQNNQILANTYYKQALNHAKTNLPKKSVHIIRINNKLKLKIA